jgi:hypothetical protein
MSNSIELELASGAEPDLFSLTPRDAASLLDCVSFGTFLGYAYQVLLSRQPDLEGEARYVANVAAGASRGSVVRDILASEEFQARYSLKSQRRMSAEDYVYQVYGDTLGRRPDSGGMQTYLRIERKIFGRRRVAAAIQKSPEGKRTGGGRGARINSLRRFYWGWLICSIPLIGGLCANRRQAVARIGRIELALSSLLRQLQDIDGGDELLVLSDSADSADGVFKNTATLSDTGTAEDERAFHVALQRFRRRQAAKQKVGA